MGKIAGSAQSLETLLRQRAVPGVPGPRPGHGALITSLGGAQSRCSPCTPGTVPAVSGSQAGHPLLPRWNPGVQVRDDLLWLSSGFEGLRGTAGMLVLSLCT